MKTKKKPHSGPANQTSLPQPTLTPRQAALEKLYRFLKIAGFIAVIIAVVVVGTIYSEQILYPFGKKELPSGKPIVFREPKLNPNKPPGPAPDGMVWIPGGEFYMGCEAEDDKGELAFPDAAEIHLVYVDGFWMDKYEVTNALFAKFVEATGYVTWAEKRPDPKDFPHVPLKHLDPFSLVFKVPAKGEKVDLRNHRSWWDIRYGASWKQPEGPGSNIKGRENHPVVHVCYHDAVAYCAWAKKRLPTEAEWEFAARGGHNRKLFCWGDDLKVKGKWLCNAWQGKFPSQNTKEDGYETTAPVGSYPHNDYGLYDMAGNVWEWCADWYQPEYYADSPERNPQGPKIGFDFFEPGAAKRVQRGGSFLCAENYCARYVVGSRHNGEITSAANHVGFRCVMDAK